MASHQHLKQRWTGRLAVAGLVLAAFGLGYVLGGSDDTSHPAAPQAPPTAHSQQHQAKSAVQQQQIWTCSMHPQIRLPNPGKCPICGMDLIPLKDPGAAPPKQSQAPPELTLSAAAEKLAQIELSPVQRRFVELSIHLVGKVTYDEARVAGITAWVPGRIDHLHVNFTGSVVQKGTPMLSLYSPQLVTAQEELLQALQAAKQLQQSGLANLARTGRATIASAREKLRLYGLSEQQIKAIQRRGAPSDHITILAPISGTVVQKNGVEGMYVKTGSRIYTIADLSRVWVKLDAYESDLSWLRTGQEVVLESEAYPGEHFKGRIAFIDPFLDDVTRTAKVRVNVPNPEGRLKPQMFVHGTVRASLSATGKPVDPQASVQATPPLVIPASAPLITGRRAVVYIAVPGRDGVYQGREIVLGPRAGAFYLVRSGLESGEWVVTKGNFKIDSDLEIQAQPSMMNPAVTKANAPAPTAGTAAAAGRELRHRMGEVLQAYLEIQAALASDDLRRALTGVGHTARAVAALEATQLQGPQQERWRELFSNQRDALRKMQEASDLTTLRSCFAIFSEALRALIKQFGIAPQQPVYVIHCPMAFDGRGANWLQSSPQVRNPYFGAQMLGCGEVTETIGKATDHPAGGSQHAG